MISLTQQDYFKYYQVLKGNFYKGASAVRALLSNPTTADGLLSAAAAIAVLFSNCSRSAVERLALQEIDSVSKADKALATQAGTMQNTTYATLTDAISVGATVDALLANDDTHWALFNLSNLFNQVVTAAQSSVPAIQNTVKFKDFYYAYKKLDWSMIYNNCTQAFFAAPTYANYTSEYVNEIGTLNSLIASKLTAADFTVLANSALSAGNIVSANRIATTADVYNSSKYFVAGLYYGATTVSMYVGFALYVKSTGKLYVSFIAAYSSAPAGINIQTLKVYLDEITMTVITGYSIYWSYEGTQYYTYITKSEVSLTDNKASNMVNQIINSGMYIGAFACIPLSNKEVFIHCTVTQSTYSPYQKGYTRHYSYRSITGQAIIQMVTGFNGDANSMVSDKKFYYATLDTYHRPPINHVYPAKLAIALSALAPYSNDSNSEAQCSTIAEMAQFLSACTYLNGSNVTTGEQVMFAKPTTVDDYAKYLGITDLHASAKYFYFNYSTYFIPDSTHYIYGEDFCIHIFRVNSICYYNTSAKTTVARTFAHVMYMNGTSPVHKLFRISNPDTSIVWQPHMQKATITGVCINSATGTVDTDFASTSDFTYVLNKDATGVVTCAKGTAPANSIALPQNMYAISLLAPEAIATNYSGGATYYKQKLFPNG